MKPRSSLHRCLAWLVLSTVVVVTVAPLGVVLKAALEPAALLFQNATHWWPSQPTLDNFRRVLGLVLTEKSLALGGSGAEVHFGRALLNSLVFTTVVVVTQTLSSAMAAYALARLQFRGRQLVFGLFVASMMVPGVVTFIPNFVLMRELGRLNTMWAMVAPFCLMQGSSIFLLRQFFQSMPPDMEEAARIDGAGPFTIFWRIVLPVSTTPVAASAVLTAIGMWNEFFWPYLVAKDEGLQVLPVALQAFKSQTPQGQPDWTGLMAAASLAVAPTLVLLGVLGRRVVESVQFSGGK